MKQSVKKTILRDKLTPLEKLRGRLPQLKTADIVLIHIKGSFLRSLIRRVTGSYWDHVTAVVYPQNENKLEHSIIIENINPRLNLFYYLVDLSLRGTEIHRLDKYLNNPQKYDIGIKRVPWLTEEHRQRFSSFLISTIDTPYWPLPFWKFFLAAIWPSYRSWFLRRLRWSCSALVQRAYYEAVTNWQDRLKVVFKEGDLSPIEMQDMISPAEIAASANARWIYNEH